MLAAAAAVLFVAALACEEKKKAADCQGPPPPGPGGPGFTDHEPEMSIALRPSAGSTVVATEGISMNIVAAPQGGFITLAGVRARNLDECIEMTAALRDESDNNRIVSLEVRPAQLVLGSDGWLTPRAPEYLFNWANMPACPFGLTADFHGREHLLEVSVVDRSGRTASASVHVTPTCDPQFGTYCLESCVVGSGATLTRSH